MKLKSLSCLVVFALLFISTTNLEAGHHCHRHRHVQVVTHHYVTPVYYQPVYAAPVYVAQPVYYSQPVVCQNQVIVRDRCCPGSLFTSFALGLGFGLLAH